MSAFVIAAAVIAVLGVFMALLWKALDADSMRQAAPWIGGIALLLTVAIGAILNSTQSDEAQGPCVREAQGIMWNPATKTTMPYTYCAERGTWVKP